jgi:hypothetical protein
MTQRYEKEMSISRQDFFRLIPITFKNIEYEIIDHHQINAFYAGGKIEIIPGREQKRKIASLELPMLFVTFIFTSVSSEDITSFFNNFNRVYQRGGG